MMTDAPRPPAAARPRTADALTGFTRRLDTLDSRLERIEALLGQRLDCLESDARDHEQRLRALAQESTRLSTILSLAQVLQGAFSIALAALAAWLRK